KFGKFVRPKSVGAVVCSSGDRSARFARYRHASIAPIDATCHRGSRGPRCLFSVAPRRALRVAGMVPSRGIPGYLGRSLRAILPFVDLTGKAALITGTRRIGADVALALARRGADVAVSYSRSTAEATRV